MVEENDYKVQLEKIHIKEWEKDVFIRPITFEEEIQWEKSVDKDNPGNSICQLVAMAVCDGDGKPLWTAEQLKKFPAKIVQRLHFQCLKISGLRKKDFDDLIKNFDADQPV